MSQTRLLVINILYSLFFQSCNADYSITSYGDDRCSSDVLRVNGRIVFDTCYSTPDARSLQIDYTGCTNSSTGERLWGTTTYTDNTCNTPTHLTLDVTGCVRRSDGLGIPAVQITFPIDSSDDGRIKFYTTLALPGASSSVSSSSSLSSTSLTPSSSPTSS